MSYDEKVNNDSVNLSALFQAVFRHWRAMLICSLIFAVLGASYKAVKILPNSNTSNNTTAEETELETDMLAEGGTGADYDKNKEIITEQIANASEYMNNSIRMKINPNREGRAEIGLVVNTAALEQEMENQSVNVENSTVISNTDSSTGESSSSEITIITSEAQKNASDICTSYVKKTLYGIDWSSLADKYNTSPEYLSELITVSKDEQSVNECTIEVIYTDEEGADAILSEIVNQLKDYKNTVSEEYGDHTLSFTNHNVSTVVDTSLISNANNRSTELNNLLKNLDTFNTSTGNMDTATPKNAAPETVSRKVLIKPIVKYAVAGFIGGAVLFLLIGIIVVMASGKIISGADMNRHYRFTKLAAIPTEKNKHRKGADKFFARNIINYYSSTDIPTCYQIASENIAELANKEDSIAIIGDLDKTHLTMIAQGLQEGAADYQICVLNDICSSPVDLRKLKTVNKVIIAAAIDFSKYNNLNRILDIIQTYNKEIIGSIVVY